MVVILLMEELGMGNWLVKVKVVMTDTVAVVLYLMQLEVQWLAEATCFLEAVKGIVV
jgi:hypothetical protein